MSERAHDVRRRRRPVGLAAWLLLCLALALWARISEPGGDRGLVNVLTMLAAVLAALGVYLWFVLASGRGRRVRGAVLLGVPALLVAAGYLVRIEGVSGDIVPEFRWRSGARPAPAPPPETAPTEAAPVDLARTTPADFPGFLGAGRDGRVDVRLDPDWEARPPECLWRAPIGAGWSGFAVVNGWAVTMEERPSQVPGVEGEELTSCRNVTTGELAWTRAAPGHFTHFLGGPGPRATPTIAGGRVYTLGALGRLSCLDGATGRVLWEKDLLAEYGVTPEDERANVQYGRANSPLVVGEMLVVPAGGNAGARQAGLAAFDARTGAPLWEGPPRQISFSSPRLATLAGVEQLLIVNEDTLSGHDPASGRLLWEHPWPGVTSANANVSQAVPVPPDRVFVSKGYGGGAALLRLVPLGNGGFEVRELWHDPRVLRTKLSNVVVHAGFVYGLDDGTLECVELESGRRVWKEGRYGHGQLLLAGEHLLVVSEDGEVLLLAPRPERPDAVLGRFQALHGKTWNNPALYREFLVVRNAEEAAVWRLPLGGG